MPLQYVFPDSTELRAIEQDLIPEMVQKDTVFFNDLFPLDDTSDTYKLEWEQWDNFYGLQQARGLDGQPAPVQRVGSNRFSTEPGVYGEFALVDEKELTRRGEFAKFTGSVDLTDIVTMIQRQLLQRRLDRIRYIGWTLLTTGQFLVAAPSGGYEHRDRYLFTTKTCSPGIQTVATSAPLQFLFGLLTASRGTSSRFGPGAKIYVNGVTVQRLFGNTNANDLGGKYRIGGGNTANNLGDVNGILKERGLPQIEMYDEGYSTTANTVSGFVPFIPNNVGVLVGSRPGGQPVGMYRMTLNANNDMRAGPYTQVIDTAGREVPRTVQVHDGHNGGPTIQFPSAIQVINFDTPGA